MIFARKSDFEKDRKAEIKATKKKTRRRKKAVRQKARADKKDVRRDAKDEKKDARQDARADKKGARAQKRDRLKAVRKSDLKGKDKREAKRDVRQDKRDAVKVANQQKKDRRSTANNEKKTKVKAARTTKRTEFRDIREEKRKALKALRVPKAFDRKWVSYLRFQRVQALEIFKPKTLAHLKTICRIATENRLRVRAIGSGHSFSEIGVTDDIFVQTRQMDRMLPLSTRARRRRFKESAQSTPMAEFEVGRTIIELSKALETTGHALANQGTYDGQTFWGAVSTSTHGSGLDRQPFPDMILSLVLVGEGGRAYRIEPRNGITNPQGWREAGVDELIQDNDVFNAVICSFGCMGIVYSAIIKLRDFYWLSEWSYVTTWDTFKASFGSPDDLRTFLAQWADVSMLVAPTKAKKGKKDGVSFAGEYPMSITLRNETDVHRRIGGRFMDRLGKLFEDLHIISGKAPAEGRWWRPKLGDLRRDDTWMARQVIRQTGKRGWTGRELDPDKLPIQRRNKCYRIFPKGGKLFGGYGIEVAFPLTQTFEVMDRIIDVAETNADDRLFHSAPVAIRFVAPSRAYASPQFDRETVMFEVLMAKGTAGGVQALRLMEREMLTVPGVRVHWGLHVDQINENNADFARMYPRWDRFRRVFRRFNQEGIFHNDFTARIGLSR